jgi:hypothetical protein
VKIPVFATGSQPDLSMADEALYDEFGECVPTVASCIGSAAHIAFSHSFCFRYIGPGIDDEEEDDALEAAFNASAARAVGAASGDMGSGSDEEDTEARATSTAVVLHEDKKCGAIHFSLFISLKVLLQVLSGGGRGLRQGC